MTSKVQPAADYWTVDRENLGTRLCYIWWGEKQRAKWRNFFKKEEIFWMNNKAIIESGFRRIWRIQQISEGVIHLSLWPLWIIPSLIYRILHILRKPNSIIAKYSLKNRPFQIPRIKHLFITMTTILISIDLRAIMGCSGGYVVCSCPLTIP